MIPGNFSGRSETTRMPKYYYLPSPNEESPIQVGGTKFQWLAAFPLHLWVKTEEFSESLKSLIAKNVPHINISICRDLAVLKCQVNGPSSPVLHLLQSTTKCTPGILKVQSISISLLSPIPVAPKLLNERFGKESSSSHHQPCPQQASWN